MLSGASTCSLVVLVSVVALEQVAEALSIATASLLSKVLAAGQSRREELLLLGKIYRFLR
jgi:hypothetical protein